jgi:arylsulfatase A-like enzyme
VVSDQPWYFADVLPTAADIAGVAPPADIDGVSVLPTLLGKEQDLSERFMYWEFFESGYIQIAVRWRDWKAVRLRPEKSLELYDLSKDISETTDIAADNPDVIAKIEEWLKTARTESLNWPTK